MNRAERLWILARTVPLWRLGAPAAEQLYDHLNAVRFGNVLPARYGRTLQVDVQVMRHRVIERDRAGNVAELLGQWDPAPEHGFASRRGWGEIHLFGSACGDTLLHELVHQALDTVNLPNGHGEPFQRCARDVGYQITGDDLAAAAAERGGMAAPALACWRRR